MIPSVLIAMLKSQAAVVTPALEQILAEYQAAGVDVTKHADALQGFLGSLSTLAGVFNTPGAKP